MKKQTITPLFTLFLACGAEAGELRTMPDVQAVNPAEVQAKVAPKSGGAAAASTSLKADDKFAMGWALISKAKKTETDQVEEGLALWKQVPDVQTRLVEVMRVEANEPTDQQGHRFGLVAALSRTKSRFAVEFLISQLDNCDAQLDGPQYPGRDYGPPTPVCLLAAEFLNRMELEGAPYGPVDTPQQGQMAEFKAAWKAWYEKNKNTLAD